MKGKVGGQWNKIFMEIFRSMSRSFLLLSPVSLTELCPFWYGLKDRFTLHKLAKSRRPLKLMTSQRVERTWIRTGGYGRFRGEWVNVNLKIVKSAQFKRVLTNVAAFLGVQD